MKRLILQTYYHDDATKVDNKVGCYLACDSLAFDSERRFRIYADSIGADYKMIRKPPFPKVPSAAWARFAILWENEYDEVAYFDADILPSKCALGISIFNYPGIAKKTERVEGSKQDWHVNAGVFKLTKQECIKMKRLALHKPFIRALNQTGKNQSQFNEMYKKATGKKPAFLDPRWNCTRPHHKPRLMAHYIGHQKTARGNQFGSYLTCPVYNENWSYEFIEYYK